MLTLCGRCGTYGTGLPLVARLVAAAPGVAPDDMEVTFVWHAWHLWHWAGGSLGCWGAVLFCVAGVALGDMDISCEQVWQLVTWMFTLCRPVLWQVEWHLMTWMSLWCGRRSTSLLVAVVPPLFCVAGMVLGHMEALGWLVARFVVRRRAVLCGRCGTYGTGLALVWWHRSRSCVAGVALGDVTYLGVTVVGSGVALTTLGGL